VLLEVSSSEAQSGLLETLERFLSDSMEAGLIKDGVIAKSGTQARDLWRIREGLVEAQKFEGASVKHDISVPVSKVACFITSAHAAIEEWMPGIRPNAFGHVGDGNIHYNIHQPVAAEKAAFLARQAELNRIVHDIAVGLNGSISAEHGIGRLKVGELAHYKEPLELEMMRRVKQALDPGGIMNPGKILAS
jgi:D-lactate dehydrogenase (cytochrome)